jgi:DNA-binding response OmpR family regulator
MAGRSPAVSGKAIVKVLVVEDNEADSTLARVLFEMSGHTVWVASTAYNAVMAIRHSTPDIVMLDLMLPDASGVALIRRLRAEPAIQPIPILAVSAYSDRFPRLAQLDAGCDAFLAKPLDTRTLVQRVEKLKSECRRGAAAG